MEKGTERYGEKTREWNHAETGVSRSDWNGAETEKKGWNHVQIVERDIGKAWRWKRRMVWRQKKARVEWHRDS